jgi:hypothetical protein
VNAAIEFVISTNAATASGPMGSAAFPSRASMTFAEVCAAKSAQPDQLPVATASMAVAQNGISGTTASGSAIKKSAPNSQVASLPNLLKLPVMLPVSAAEIPAPAKEAAPEQIPTIQSASEIAPPSLPAGVSAIATLPSIHVPSIVSQPQVQASLALTSATTPVNQAGGSGALQGSGANSSGASRQPEIVAMSSSSPASPFSNPLMQAANARASSQQAAQVLNPTGLAQPVVAGSPLQLASSSLVAPIGSTGVSMPLQFQTQPDSIAVTPAQQKSVSANASPGNPSPSSLPSSNLSFGNPSPTNLSPGDLSGASSPSIDAVSEIGRDLGAPSIPTAPSQDSTQVIRSQTPQNSASSLTTLFGASPNVLPQKSAGLQSTALPIAPGMENRNTNPTSLAVQQQAQKPQLGATTISAGGTDLVAAVHSAVAQSMTEFSNGKVLAPTVPASPSTPSPSTHGANPANASNFFTAPVASTTGNNASANTTSPPTKNASSGPATAAPGSATSGTQNTGSNSNAQSAGSANNSSDGQGKGSTATESVAGVAQASATAIPVPVSAPEPASDPASAHAASSSPQSASGAANPADFPLSVPSTNVAPATGAIPVQAAQMVTTAAQSEMRIGMNTANFGSIEVRAVVHAGDVGVSIGSEKGDLRSALATEIPGIANALEQQNLRLAPVSFQQHGFAFSSNLSSGGDSQSRSFSPRSFPKAFQPDSSSPEVELHESGSTTAIMSVSATGISILA